MRADDRVFQTLTQHHRPTAASIDPPLASLLRRVALAGLVAVLLLPAARGYSAWLGWMPLWLLGMPLSALWALHGFRLPARVAGRPGARRRRRPQARRRKPRTVMVRLARVA